MDLPKTERVQDQNVDLPEPEQDQSADVPNTKPVPEASAAPESAAEPETMEREKLEPAQGHTITITDLDAYYGDRRVIKDISITFPPNQVTALIGPSGCGKSTLVRCINRMHEEIPKARAVGKVLLDDEDVYGSGVDITAVRRQIGMVFQKANPFPTMSIFDNVASGLKLAGIRGDAMRERVNQSLRAVGLWSEVSDRLNAAGAGLSGGPAAAPVHRSYDRRRARGDPDGRAVLGA